MPAFSFKYPSRFSVPSEPDISGIRIGEKNLYNTNVRLGNVLLNPSGGLYGSGGGWITVAAYDPEDTLYLVEYFGMDKDGFLNIVSGNDSWLEDFHDIVFAEQMRVNVTYPTVGDIPARQQLVTYDFSLGGIEFLRLGSIPDSHIIIDFVHDGRLWVITLYGLGPKLDHPPPYFAHLLETFKIYDE
jgi:CubicO group peptidase (beta-lactamase class C family)